MNLYKHVRQWVDPRLTFPLLLITSFLFLVGIGDLFAAYSFAVANHTILNNATLLTVIAGLISVIPACGLFNVQSWARKAQIVISTVICLCSIVSLFMGSPQILDALIHGFIIYYLMRSDIKKIFTVTPAN